VEYCVLNALINATTKPSLGHVYIANILNSMNSFTFVLFDKYCLIVDQLGSKDLSHDFQLNCVISYFLSTFTTSGLKIDMTKRVKKF
jgi:hypothetical protein